MGAADTELQQTDQVLYISGVQSTVAQAEGPVACRIVVALHTDADAWVLTVGFY